MWRPLLPAILLLLLAPAALAQLPTQPPSPCGPIEVLAPVPPEAIPPGAQGSITLTVENDGSRAADVTVAASTTSQGWRIVSTESQTATGVAAGASTTFTFTLQPDDGAAATATVNFATTASCPAPGPAGCPAASPQLCQAQGQPQTATVALGEREGFRFPGLDGLIVPLPYLVAGILLIGLAVALPLLLRKRAPQRATATCPEPLKPVKPGKGASFPLEVRNPSDAARKLHLEVGPVPEGWSAFLPLPEIQLAARESRSLWLMVRAPVDARPGQTADVQVTATDAGRPERPTVVKMRAEVEADGG